MRNRQKSASNKNGYKPRNPIYCPIQKKPYISHIENISPKMPWLSQYTLDNIKCAGKTNRIRLKISKKKS